MPIHTRLLRALWLLLLSLFCQWAGAGVAIDDQPLLSRTAVPPNILYSLDDSSSMVAGYIPDNFIFPGWNGVTAAYFNPIYYNPLARYDIPKRSDGRPYSTSFRNAWIDGFNHTLARVGSNWTSAIDLSQPDFSPNWNCFQWQNNWLCYQPGFISTYWGAPWQDSFPPDDYVGPPAAYHLYFADVPGGAQPSDCASPLRSNSQCYLPVLVGSAQDISPGDRAQKEQNFANWYSFYSLRRLALQSAVVNSLALLSDGQARVGWLTIPPSSPGAAVGCDTLGTVCSGADSALHDNRLKVLDAAHRTNMLDWVATMKFSNGTPLRSAIQRAGEFFKTEEPYRAEPYRRTGDVLGCRRNFTILITDGMWNYDQDLHVGDVDSTQTTLPDGTVYTPVYPYKNGGSPGTYRGNSLSFSDSLADIAFKYWATDLRSDIPDKITPYMPDRSGTGDTQYWNARNNPATWQHMTNFIIGFGLAATLTDPAWGNDTYSGDYAKLVSGEKTWPGVYPSNTGGYLPGHVYDLWHAAINSRGQFFNADTPHALDDALQTTIRTILSVDTAAAALSTNSTGIQADSLIFQAKFDPSDWHGQMLAIAVNEDGTVGAQQWDASKKIPAPNQRKLFTWNGDVGVALDSCNTGNNGISSTQKAALDRDANDTTDNRCTDRLAWLRGDSRREVRNGGSFRNRLESVLGDIVNSDPAYVKNTNYGYAKTRSSLTSDERDKYSAFVASNAQRVPVLYAGANDGMLHAFRADLGNTDSGKELFAYVPAGVFDKLNRLPSPSYTHTYFVDGAPKSGDAFWDNAWHTVLVGALGAGGRSVYALDVTDPENFSADKVLWEFTDNDMGLGFSQPQIARLANGQWAAIFGNGYNSASADVSYLYVVDIKTGALIKKIALGTARDNGLSTPVVYDADGDLVADVVYAGDLGGNLWKVGLALATALDTTNVAPPLLLAQATTPAGRAQAITVQPTLYTSNTGSPPSGVMVLFGTGRYLASSDSNSSNIDSFYGIWDNGTAVTVDRSMLQQQSLSAEHHTGNWDTRTVSNNSLVWGSKRGWFLDLALDPRKPAGERVLSSALAIYDRVIFATAIPSTDQCDVGGTSWLMELDAATGGRIAQSVFDLNGDGVFDVGDQVGDLAVSGVRSTVGIIKTPVWLEQAGSKGSAFKLASGSSGGILNVRNRIGGKTTLTVKRTTWQQLQ